MNHCTNKIRASIALLSLLVAIPANATLTITLNNVDTISGTWTPAPGTVFAQAVFNNVPNANPPGQVTLDLKPLNIGGGFVTEWYFEVANNLPALTLVDKTGTGYDVNGLSFENVSTDPNMKKYKLDFGFDFGNSPQNRFEAGDVVTVTLGYNVSEGSFSNLSEGDGGYGTRVLSAMKVQGLPGGGSARFSGVPEPATILSGVLLFLPFCASAIRTLRRRV